MSSAMGCHGLQIYNTSSVYGKAMLDALFFGITYFKWKYFNTNQKSKNSDDMKIISRDIHLLLCILSFLTIRNRVSLHISLMATLGELTCSTYLSQSIHSVLFYVIYQIVAKYITYLNHMKRRLLFYQVLYKMISLSMKF